MRFLNEISKVQLTETALKQMREAYRLHKQLLTTNKDSNYALLFIYLNKDKPQYAKLEAALKVLLKKLADENN